MNAVAAATMEAPVDPSGTPVVKVIGELDLFTVGPVHAAIQAIVTAKIDRILFDLSELQFMDGTGLRMLLSVTEQVAEVHLLVPSPIARKVTQLTGPSGAFPIPP